MPSRLHFDLLRRHKRRAWGTVSMLNLWANGAYLAQHNWTLAVCSLFFAAAAWWMRDFDIEVTTDA